MSELNEIWKELGMAEERVEEKIEERVERPAKAEEVTAAPAPPAKVEESAKAELVIEDRELFVEEPVPTKEVWLIFGDKGTGKTTLAMSFPGEILVLSFDRKSAIIKATVYKGDKRIHVFDVVKWMDYSTPQAVVKSAELTFVKLNALLDNYVKHYPQPDWVVIDGAQIFQQICEWTMRARHNLEAFEGISNLNLWKERRLYIRQVHNKALNLAKQGVIYTTYVEKDEVIIKGEVVTRKDSPAWIDVLIYETDYVLYTYTDANGRFMVRVVSSKNASKVPHGTYDITGRGFWEVVRR